MRLILLILMLIMGNQLMAQEPFVNEVVVDNSVNEQIEPLTNEEMEDVPSDEENWQAIDTYDAEYLESEASTDIPDEYFLEDAQEDNQDNTVKSNLQNASSL